MSVVNLISDIRFRMVGPQYDMRRFDVDNVTIINPTTPGMEQHVADLCGVPRMSTHAIGLIINQAVRDMAPDMAYVNIGVWHGYTLFAGMVGNLDKICVGVDNFSEFGGPKAEFNKLFGIIKSQNHVFHEMDYREYFKNTHIGSIGVYMYDGKHDFADQMDGLRLAEPYFAPGTIILVDDINWPDPYNATMKFLESSPRELRREQPRRLRRRHSGPTRSMQTHPRRRSRARSSQVRVPVSWTRTHPRGWMGLPPPSPSNPQEVEEDGDMKKKGKNGKGGKGGDKGGKGKDGGKGCGSKR
jgi:hypothetical protein